MSRPVNQFRTASKENYNKFKDKYPNIDITYDEFKKIIYTYNDLIVKFVLETGDPIKFPFGLGTLVINKYKPKTYRKNKEGKDVCNLSINWKETKKQGKYVYLLNSHTEGYKYYFMWNYWKARIKCAYIWKFEMARVHSRLLKSYLLKPNGQHKDIYKEHPRKR